MMVKNSELREAQRRADAARRARGADHRVESRSWYADPHRFSETAAAPRGAGRATGGRLAAWSAWVWRWFDGHHPS